MNKSFTKWVEQRIIQEGAGDIRQVRIKKIDPHGWIHFELMQGGQPTGQLGTSSKIIGVKVVRNIGDGTFLTQVFSESGTVYMAVINKEMIDMLKNIAVFNAKNLKASDRVQQHIQGNP